MSRRKKVASVRLIRMKMEENRKKKTVEAKIVEDDLEEDSGYVELFPSLLGSYKKTAGKCAEK